MALAKPIDLRTVTAVQLRRFWGQVDKSLGHGPSGECWLWTGGLDKGGYGRTGIGLRANGTQRMVAVHRLSYILANSNVVLGDQDLICHECDTPRCANHNHLWPGTYLENVADRDAKKRTAKGERSGMARFSDAQVLAIRGRVDLSHAEASREFGLSVQHVHDLRAGLSRRNTGGIRSLFHYKKGIMDASNLTDARIVLAIRGRVDLSHAEASREFRVTREYVWKIRSGYIRRDIGGLRSMSNYKGSRTKRP